MKAHTPSDEPAKQSRPSWHEEQKALAFSVDPTAAFGAITFDTTRRVNGVFPWKFERNFESRQAAEAWFDKQKHCRIYSQKGLEYAK